MMDALRIDLNEKRASVQELVRGCPQSHNLLNYRCPIRVVRKLTTENRTRYIDGLSEDQLDNIIHFHQDCYRLAS